MNFTDAENSLASSKHASPNAANRRSMAEKRNKMLLAHSGENDDVGSLREAAEYINKRRYGGGAPDQSDSDDEKALVEDVDATPVTRRRN